MKTVNLEAGEEFIKLDSLLKVTGLVSTGGQAKVFIQNGEVKVNDEICLQRGKKIKAGDIIQLFDDIITVKSVE